MIQVGDFVTWDDERNIRGIVVRLAGKHWGPAGAQVRWEATPCARWAAATTWEPTDKLVVLSNTTKEIK